MTIENEQLMDLFRRERKVIYSIVIFEEFLKEIAATLYVKELGVQMLESYELAFLEDVKMECAFARFRSEVV